ncbi:unnamed protein product [Arabis nemorensis]|uniref:Phenylalanyl-tRNA synthetase domain-containing protein n=1 Tax=Arabis nemorensis TaxID=586526 RepID=A0A565C485_9BRAS|nr:unnamed protein product [Arabis nemorensis]
MAMGQLSDAGHLHPFLRFEEMPTNNYVERAASGISMHCSSLSITLLFLRRQEDYVERVKQVHESGGYGSRGYNYEWKREEANKNLLRTHTTAVSARMLYSLAEGPSNSQSLQFSKNDAVDRTHLAEFHQTEGLICDSGLAMDDLMSVLQDFFSRLGMSELKFKHAYNPYTEPSMEIFSYHKGLRKWVEILACSDPKCCEQWVSQRIPTMILYGIDNIRDLFGHKVDLDLIKRNPICRIGIE